MDLQAIIKQIRNGDLPSSRDERQFALYELTRNNSEPITGLLLAIARREDFQGNAITWGDWARTELGITSSLHHLRKIGDLLYDMHESDVELFSRLVKLSRDKLIAISRLELGVIAGFMEKFEVEDMNRDQVRDAVSEALGEPERAKKANESNHWQPDLFEAAEMVSELASREMYLDKRFDRGAAVKYFQSGMILVNNAVSYMSTCGDIEPVALFNAEQAIRGEADKIAEIRQRLAVSKGA